MLTGRMAFSLSETAKWRMNIWEYICRKMELIVLSLLGGGVNQNVLEQIGDLETDLEKTKQYFEHKLSGFCCYEISVSSEEELMQFIDGLTGNFTIYCNRSGAISRIDGFVIKGGQSGYGAVMRINYFYNKYPIEFRQKYNGVWSEWMNPGEKWDSYGKQNKTED